MKSLNKKLLLLLFPIALFSACKKDSPTQGPTIATLVAGEEKIAVGQYMEITSSVTDGDTDASKLSYSWSGTDGFKSTESVAKWTPSKSGTQTITLSVSDGTTSATKTISFTVAAPDYRLAVWGNTSTKIQLFESKAGKTPLSITATELFYQADVSTTYDVYVLINGLVTRGATVSTKVNTNSNQYMIDYSNVVNTLVIKYGNSITSKIYYKTEDVKNQLTGRQDLWADAIVRGDARLETIWHSGSNLISHELFKSSTSTSVIAGTYYSPKPASTAVSSSGNKIAQAELERLFHIKL